MDRGAKKTKLVGQLSNARLEGEYEDVDFTQLGMNNVEFVGSFRNCLFKRQASEKTKYPRQNNKWGGASRFKDCDVSRDEDDLPII